MCLHLVEPDLGVTGPDAPHVGGNQIDQHRLLVLGQAFVADALTGHRQVVAEGGGKHLGRQIGGDGGFLLLRRRQRAHQREALPSRERSEWRVPLPRWQPEP